MEHSAVNDALKLLVVGFTDAERQLLDAIVRLSQRRQPRISLLDMDASENADVVMVDALDAKARNWVEGRSWLERKVVIWVDAQDGQNRNVMRRPIQWPNLPIMLARALEQSAVHKEDFRNSASGNGSILVVDDSAAVRSQLRSLFEENGLSVTEADNAEAAIKAVTAASYACVLMDVLMPGIDGYEACRRIKAVTYGNNRPAVIMLTSQSSPFDRIRGKMAGCDAYLTKPIDHRRLDEVISRYIHRGERKSIFSPKHSLAMSR